MVAAGSYGVPNYERGTSTPFTMSRAEAMDRNVLHGSTVDLVFGLPVGGGQGTLSVDTHTGAVYVSHRQNVVVLLFVAPNRDLDISPWDSVRDVNDLLSNADGWLLPDVRKGQKAIEDLDLKALIVRASNAATATEGSIYVSSLFEDDLLSEQTLDAAIQRYNELVDRKRAAGESLPRIKNNAERSVLDRSKCWIVRDGMRGYLVTPAAEVFRLPVEIDGMTNNFDIAREAVRRRNKEILRQTARDAYVRGVIDSDELTTILEKRVIEADELANYKPPVPIDNDSIYLSLTE